jgi:hypothetical protein
MKPGSKYYHLIHNVRPLPRGAANMAIKGVDFTCEAESFRGIVYDLAVTKGGGWVGTCTIIGDTVVYAFFKRTDYMRPNLPAYPLVQKLRGEQHGQR